MNTTNHRLITVFLSAILLQVAACAPLSINPPTPERSTLLILPFELVREAQSSRYGFAYAYEIVSNENSTPPLKVLFKLPVKHDMVIVDTLPPGNYRVSKLLTIPVGSGDRTYNTRGDPVNYRFSLEAGKITILPYSLRVRTFNEIPGRGMSTTYSKNILRISSQQKSSILDKIKALPNFSAWELLDEKKARSSSSQVQIQHQQYVVAEKFRGNWNGVWRPITATDAENCNNGSLGFDIDGTHLRGVGTDSEGNRYRISASFIGNGVIRGKLSLNRTRLAKVSGKLYDDGTILGSFDYGNDCMAEWKARKG